MHYTLSQPNDQALRTIARLRPDLDAETADALARSSLVAEHAAGLDAAITAAEHRAARERGEWTAHVVTLSVMEGTTIEIDDPAPNLEGVANEAIKRALRASQQGLRAHAVHWVARVTDHEGHEHRSAHALPHSGRSDHVTVQIGAHSEAALANAYEDQDASMGPAPAPSTPTPALNAGARIGAAIGWHEHRERTVAGIGPKALNNALDALATQMADTEAECEPLNTTALDALYGPVTLTTKATPHVRAMWTIDRTVVDAPPLAVPMAARALRRLRIGYTAMRPRTAEVRVIALQGLAEDALERADVEAENIEDWTDGDTEPFERTSIEVDGADSRG